MLHAYDAHSMAQADHYCAVNSLYFDTLNYRFLKPLMWGTARRFNMRMRSHRDRTTGPYFAEIKLKKATCVRKFRALVNASEWPLFMHQETSDTQLKHAQNKKHVSRELFLQLAEACAIEPKIFTCYKQ